MDGTAADRRPLARTLHLVTVLTCALFASFTQQASAQETFTDPLEGAEVTWGVELFDSEAQVLNHRRQRRWRHGGNDAEELQLRFKNVGRRVYVYRKTPRTQALEDLKASLWVRCRIRGLQLGLGVTFPHQIDPETQEPLFAPIYGRPSDGGDQFQQLTVAITLDEMSRVQTLLRAKLSKRVDPRTIDFRNAYVDQVVLLVPTAVGPGEVQWDDLEMGPIIPLPSQDGVATPAAAAAASAAAEKVRLTWADNRLLAGGEAITPRFITYQGEPSTLLRDLHFNAAWIDDLKEQSVIQALTGEGIGIFATPPAPPEEGREKVSMPPFGPEANAVDCWMLGRLDVKKLDDVARWAEMVQDADRQRRLLLGDVSGHVREVNRCVPLLSASRHIPHTSHSPADYVEFLESRRNQALAGRPMGTLLPTETAEAIRTTRRSTDTEPVLEPEQIALCTHLAAASGYKLFGFWTHTSLDSDAPGMEERRQQLKLLNIELQLLEPWLASGSIVRTADVRTGEPVRAAKTKKSTGLNPFAGGWGSGSEDAGPKSPYRATMMRGGKDVLILIDCIEDGAQFQPGPMTQSNLRFLGMRYDDTPIAFEITPTSVKQVEFDLQAVAGGVEVVLKDFDQHAAIVMTSDLTKIETLKRQVAAVAPEAATAAVALAAAKLDRVEKVHLALQPISPPVPDATQSLQHARYYLRQADDDLHGQRHDEARRKSQKAMALTRYVQRAYWDHAVKRLTSPVASPHAVCFQTLPDHWRMWRRIDRQKSAGENLLRSGTFEDRDAVQTLWTVRSETTARDPVALNTKSAEGRYSLAMTAYPTSERPAPVDDPLVTLYSPGIAGQTGQLIQITGKVHVPRDLEGSTDGLVVYDTLKGSVGAHRFRKASPPGKWQTFEIYRDVLSTGEFKLVFELRGWGEAWIDDLKVNVIPAEEGVQTVSGEK
ncbi:MAG TPA: hypothetical protein VM452_15765 [Caulifigura sp.]|nr:hypothetical protein [Caulifigura sp.]